MKIFLCLPPSKTEFGPHPGLAYLAAALEKEGHQVFFQDGNLTSLSGLIDEIQKANPDLVGIYMNTVTRFETISLAEQIKAKLNLPIIVGGPHPTLMPDQLLRHYDCFDYVLRGEAEKSLVELLDCLGNNQSLEKVLGLSFRKKKKIVHNPPAPFIKNLDSLPFPKHQMFDYRRYSVPKEAEERGLTVVPMIGSRGCPFNCTFCSSSKITGHVYRARSPKNIIEEILYVNQILKADYIYFWDDHFFLSKKRTKEFCQSMIKKGLSEKVHWRCTGRVDCLDAPTLKLMKKAGCEFIAFGVEAATEEGLKFFNKKFTLTQVKEAFALSRQAGLKRRAAFIIGGDHETMATIKKQRDLIKELDPEIVGVSVLTVFPETALFQLAKSKGMFDEKIWLERSPKIPFHNNAPLYPGPHLAHDTLIKEAAKLSFWWNTMVKKNQTFSFAWGVRTTFSYLKAGNFKELANILLALFKQFFSIKTKKRPRQHPSVKKLFQEQIKRYSRPKQATDSPVIGHFKNWVRKRKIKKRLKICEFGGGAGQLLGEIEKIYPRAQLTNAEIVRNYKQYQVSKKIKFVKTSILDSGFPEKSFDVLIIRDILHHLVGEDYRQTGGNQRQALRELKRLVKPGGVIFIDEYTHGSEMASKVGYFFSRLNSKLGLNLTSLQIRASAVVAFLTPKKLKQLCKESFGKRGLKEFCYPIKADWPSLLLHLGSKLQRMIIVIEEL